MGDADKNIRHLTMAELEAGLDIIRQTPKDAGTIELIVRRPRVNERVELAAAALDLREGLVGDSWQYRRSSRSPNGGPHPDMQLNVMNARAVALVAQDRSRWKLAGDQLFVDFDLSEANLPPGTQLALGDAIIEVTAQPHTGCQKFASRFGDDAMKFVNSPVGKELRLRGINARVAKAGAIKVGDAVRKIG